MAQRSSLPALIVAGLVAVSAVYLTMPAAAPPPRTTAQSISGLSPDRYMKDVTYLASDELKGRGDGSPELDRAADYIAEQFRLAGLSPGGEAKSYFQGFDITTGAVLGAKNEFSVNGANLRMNDDFVPINFSSTAEFEGPLVFAGYGITAPEYKYDDYSSIDASGKIAVVFEREPQENDPKSVFAGTALTIQTCLGFLLTTISIELIPRFVNLVGWRYAFMILAPGPLFGVISMLKLRQLPEAVKIAHGRR
jgi:hypothetical protein